MRKFAASYAMVGATLGVIPAALLALGDRSVGHGGDTLALLAIVTLGVPGTAIGSIAGDILQHGAKPARLLVVPLGTVLGGVAGLAGGLLLQELVRTSLPVREQDSACFGFAVGAVVGTFLAGRIGGPRRIDEG